MSTRMRSVHLTGLPWFSNLCRALNWVVAPTNLHRILAMWHRISSRRRFPLSVSTSVVLLAAPFAAACDVLQEVPTNGGSSNGPDSIQLPGSFPPPRRVFPGAEGGNDQRQPS